MLLKKKNIQYLMIVIKLSLATPAFISIGPTHTTTTTTLGTSTSMPY